MNGTTDSNDTGKKSKILVIVLVAVILLGIIIYLLYTRFSVSDPSDMLEEANTLYRAGNIDEALKIYQEVIDKYPSTKEEIRAYSGVGRIYFDKKEYDKAIPYFEKRLNADQGLLDKEVTFIVNSKMGHIYFLKNDYEKALQYLNQALTIASEDPGIIGNGLMTVNTQIGLVYSNKGEYDKAVSYFKVAYDTDPNSALREFHLGRAYYLNKEYDQAETHLTHYINSDNRDPKRAKAAIGYLEAIKEYRT